MPHNLNVTENGRMRPFAKRLVTGWRAGTKSNCTVDVVTKEAG